MVVDAAIEMLRTLPDNPNRAEVIAAWHALQRVLGWDSRDNRNRLDNKERTER